MTSRALTHPLRSNIEHDILRGEPLTQIARQYDLTVGEVVTHRRCVAAEIDTDMSTYGRELLMRARHAEAELLLVLETAKNDNDKKLILQTIDRITRLLETESKIVHAVDMEERLKEIERIMQQRGTIHG